MFYELAKLNISSGAFSAEEMFDQSKKILAAFNNPQNKHQAIHIAGTSGKGTVAYYTDAILRAHDKHTGLLVSPHVYDIRERIQIDGQFISEKVFLEKLNLLRQFIQPNGDITLPYFAVVTLMGFLALSEKKLDYITVETGLGGRLDPTNTMNSRDKYCVLTQIGLDHTQILGKTYEHIAREKAAIIHSGNSVTALHQRESVNRMFLDSAKLNKTSVSWVEQSGNYETDDYLLAVNATSNLAKRDGWQFDEELAKRAVTNLYIPGRYEKRVIRQNNVILDGAHNPQKLAALVSRLESEEQKSMTVVLALGEHKDYLHSLEPLKSIASHLICTQFFYDKPELVKRAVPAELLAKTARQLGFSKVTVEPSPVLALRLAEKDNVTILVTGSFYLLGEVDKAFI